MSDRWKQSGMIRRAVDLCPDGICFGTENGSPVLVNQKMDTLIKNLLGCAVMNTEEIWKQLKQRQLKHWETGIEEENELRDLQISGISEQGRRAENSEILFLQPSDGTIWQFERMVLETESCRYLQYTASDISQLYELQQKLSRDVADLKQRQNRQRLLLREIISNNRSSELLNARIKIHDDFGQCLIASRQYSEKTPDADQLGLLMRRWKFCVDSMLVTDTQPDKKDSAESELSGAAEMIGCRIIFEGQRPASEEARRLMYASVREALTNAVRHGRATELHVGIENTGTVCRVRITDNGSSAPEEIREGNGLSNLRRRLEQAGALMEIHCEKGVELDISLPE